MEWQRTTFGELKAGDVYTLIIPCDDCGYDVVFIRTTGTCQNMLPNDTPIYRLVSPEREALERIRDMKRNDRDWDSVVWDMQRIAKSALEVKP